VWAVMADVAGVAAREVDPSVGSAVIRAVGWLQRPGWYRVLVILGR